MFFCIAKIFSLETFFDFRNFFPQSRGGFCKSRDDRRSLCTLTELDMRHISLAPLWSDFSDPELNALLHPASAFDHPRDVVSDPDLTLEEKRAILSSWASDACAVESQPALRRPPGSKQPVEFDEIVDALRSLEKGPPLKWKRVVGRGRSGSNESPIGGMPA
jgi:hypothetical protein